MPKNDYVLYGIIFVAVVVAVFIYVTIKEKFDLKKAGTGKDKERFKEAVRQVMGDGDYTIAYSHWEDVKHQGRTTTTTYFHHALAWSGDKLWIMPLSFDKDLILPDRPVLVTKDVLGIVTVDKREDKKTGKVYRVAATLNDKDGKKLVDLGVDATNTRDDRFHHVNLLQEEECAQFASFISRMAGEVSRENADLPGRLKDQDIAKRTKNARIFGIVGMVCSILFPVAGLVMGVITLVTAPKPRDTGGKMGLPIILGIAALVVSVLMLAFDMPLLTELLKGLG